MIFKILKISGVLCLLYYLVIILYAGIRTDFSFIWIMIAGLLYFLPDLNHLRMQLFKESVLSGVIKWGFLLCVSVAAVVFIAVGSMVVKGMFQRGQPGYDYVVVLGAQVKGENPSRSLRKRLDAAFTYLEANEKTKAVLSGGQGPGEDITEAECMRRYLTERGIEEARLILEDESTSTYENMIFSRQKIADPEAKVGIISNDFHIYRAVALAKKQGFVQPEGIAASSDAVMEVHFVVREIAAVIKDKIVGNI